MIAWFVTTLQQRPELAVFLALLLGYLVGPLSVKSFHLGNVTATLLAGVLVGQLNVPVGGPLEAFSFMLFLFAVGYKVGPQFFAGLSKDGVAQIFFAVFSCLAGLGITAAFALIVHFNVGQAAGLLAGALTQSAAIGTASDAIGRLGLDPTVTKTFQTEVAVGYAVTYVIATFVAVLVCSRLVPWLFRFDLAEECVKLAAEMGLKPELPPGVFSANLPNSVRALRADANGMAGKSVGEIESAFAQRKHRVFIAAIRRGTAISSAIPSDLVAQGDVVALAGPSEAIISEAAGAEVHDPELLDIPLQQLEVVVTNKEAIGLTVEELMTGRGRGVVLKKITRTSVEIPALPRTVIERGDTLQIAGFHDSVERAAKALGYPLRPSPTADVVFISLAIVIGGLFGMLSVTIGGIPVGLGASGGALVAGLVGGYLRGRSPTFGNISPGAQWVFDSFALTVFIAVVGIKAGPSFIGGVAAAGIPLVAGGILVPLIALLLAACFGKFVLRLNNVVLCGALAGADTTTAALGAVQDAAKSNLVTLGYTITYAVGNILLTVWGTVIVALFATKTSI